jgi:hypothetical protein
VLIICADNDDHENAQPTTGQQMINQTIRGASDELRARFQEQAAELFQLWSNGHNEAGHEETIG